MFGADFGAIPFGGYLIQQGAVTPPATVTVIDSGAIPTGQTGGPGFGISIGGM